MKVDVVASIRIGQLISLARHVTVWGSCLSAFY